MLYEILKALHIIAVIAWMAGLLYLPRLFVYHADAEPGSKLGLGQTAGMAFDPSSPSAEPATIIMEPSVPDPAPPASEVGFSFRESPRLPADVEPIVIDSDPAPISDSPTLIMPEPPPLVVPAPPPPPKDPYAD